MTLSFRTVILIWSSQPRQTLIAARITGIMIPKLKMNPAMAALPFKEASREARSVYQRTQQWASLHATNIVLRFNDPTPKDNGGCLALLINECSVSSGVRER
jgi:hypothetical protein